MPQKRARPLYLAKLLQERTDEDHPLTVPEMLDCLARQGIPAERKAIYEDLELLRTVGMDIVHTKTKTHNYYLGQRTFQLAEVKLLIDVVQASPFLTARKSMELIRKLESLTSVHQAAGLSRQVYVLNRLKTPNEQLYYLIDAIDRAIQAGRVIRFRYFDWTVQGRRIYRHNGAWYEESPVALCVDRNYYLITYRPGQDKYIHFRVDRMDSLEVTEKPRAPLPPGFDLASYVRSIPGAGREAPQRGPRPLRGPGPLPGRGKRRGHCLRPGGCESHVFGLGADLREGRENLRAPRGAGGSAGPGPGGPGAV